jgi:hypothetical protein
MALVVADRVQETTSTTGTSDYVLIGAATGYQSFGAVMANADTTYYAITNDTDWEVGIGTYSTTGPTLARTTILASSSGGSAVSWGVGVKNIFISYAASKSAYLDANGDLLVSDKIVHAGDTNTAIRFPAADTVSVETGGTERFKVENSTITTTVPIALPANPTLALQAATKQYVDALIASGIHFHQPVRVESPINLNATYNNGTSGVGATLTNAGTQVALVIDGVTVATNDRVLVYQQTTQTQNGIYVVTNTGSVSTNWVLTRSADANTYVINNANGLSEGSTVFVQQGTTGAGETYTCNTSGTITFGTTNITFAQISSAQIYSAGTGLALTGTVFSNTAPDQVVTLTQGGATTISGAYPNFTISSVNTTYTDGGGIGLTGTTFSVAAGSGLTQDADGLSHADTSSQSSVDNTGATFVQDVTLDTFGHVTGLASVTVTPSLIGAPSTTGVGASGSWGISVTGTALNVTGTVAVANGGTGATTAAQALTNLGLTATAAELNTLDGITATTTELNYTDGVTSAIQTQLDNKQPLDADLTAIAALAVTDGNFIVGNGTTWVVESGATARTSLGLGSLATASTISNDNWSGTDLSVANGGTGASDAGTARTNLGLAIGSNVQAYDAGLQSISGLTTSANQMIYTTASDTYATTSLTAAGRAILDDADAAAQRTTLGLGTMATQASSSVTITGGTISGITDLAIADGGTGASDAGTARTNLNVPTRTGGDASGTWGINVTGTAGSTTVLNQVANFPTANGQDFNSLTTGGYYNIIWGNFTGILNAPSGSANSYGTLLVQNGTNFTSQLYMPHATSSSPATRVLYNGSWTAWAYTLSSANYNSYAPTLTGTGASGTWGIAISGNAATSTLSVIQDTRAGALTPNDYADYRVSYEFTNQVIGGDWHSAITPKGWSDTYAAWQLWGPSSTTAHENWYLRSGVNTTWNPLRTILHSGNYTSYAPTLTGGGASGNWGVNVTGSSYSVNLGGTGNTISSSAWAGGAGYHGYTYNGGNFRFGFSSTSGVVDVYADGNFYATDSSHLVLHAGNYNSYAPTLTGTGASGNWGINVTGSAATLSGLTATVAELNYTDGVTSNIQTQLNTKGPVGGGSDAVFYENGRTVTTNYTITDGKNAMSAGPITINSGVTVTVGAGEVWTIV